MTRRMLLALALLTLGLAGCGGSSAGTTSSAGGTTATAAATPASSPFLASTQKVSLVSSTIPANGDVNPYGLALVPVTIGKLQAHNLLVSNFNDKANNQGTGTTIVQVTPGGKQSLFASVNASTLRGSCPGGVGLTYALSVLPYGYVVVGSLPTTNGKSATAQVGCLIVIDSSGKPVSTISGPQIAGPWGMTSTTEGNLTTLFLSNALNGGAAKGVHLAKDSTVLRIRLQSEPGHPPKVIEESVVANEIPWRDDPAALVVGPTGLALAQNGTLYLADTLGNRITAIRQALTRTSAAAGGGATVSSGGALNQPLGLTLAPNGDILTANAADGNIVETTPAGKQLLSYTADTKTGAGSLFGLAVAPGGNGLYYVDDGENTLQLLR
jgi:hypothetical protein